MTPPSSLAARPAAEPPVAAILPALAFIALCFIWGSTYLGIRMAVQTVPPLLMIGARSVLAGLIMAGFALWRGAPWPDRRAWLRAGGAGVLLFLGGQSLLATGEQRISSGQASVLGAMLALFMPLASWSLRDGGPPGLRTSLALAAGFAGVAVLVRPGSGVMDPTGGAIVLLSVLSWAYGGAVSRKYPAAPSVPLTGGLQMILGGLACLAASVASGEAARFHVAAVSLRSGLAFAYLVMFGSLVGFSAFAWLVRIWPPERLATYTYVNPVVALLLGAGLAGEALTPREGVATVLILGAVAVAMLGRNTTRR